MVFTQVQIQDLLNILKKNQLLFIAMQLGIDYLSNYDKAILKTAGIDVDKFKNSKGVVEYAFLFGMLADAIGSDRAKKMDYRQFKKFVASGNFVPLTNEEEYALIKKAVTAINSTITVPCTGCAYCVDGCPMNIAIPKYFSLYNADLQEVEEKGWTPQGEYYNNLTKTFGKASDCVECGQCEGVCPQHLSIIQYLKDVAGHFEK